MVGKKTPKNNILWYVKIWNSDFYGPYVKFYWHTATLIPLCTDCGSAIIEQNTAQKYHGLNRPKPSRKRCSDVTSFAGFSVGFLLPSEWNLKSQSPLPASLSLFLSLVPTIITPGHVGFGWAPTWAPTLGPASTAAHLLFLLRSFPLRPLNCCFSVWNVLLLFEWLIPFLQISAQVSSLPRGLSCLLLHPLLHFIACLFPSLPFCLLLPVTPTMT